MKKKYTSLLSLLLMIYLSTVSSVDAFMIKQPGNSGVQVGAATPDTLIGSILNSAFTIIFAISTIAVSVFVVWGAFEWITSGGDKEKLGGAKKKITTALIGFVVLALAFMIVEVVGTLIGIDPTPTGGWKIPSLQEGIK